MKKENIQEQHAHPYTSLSFHYTFFSLAVMLVCYLLHDAAYTKMYRYATPLFPFFFHDVPSLHCLHFREMLSPPVTLIFLRIIVNGDKPWKKLYICDADVCQL